MKILCATDFSAPAGAAAGIAVDLAQRTAGSVELVHVLPPPTPTRDLQALATDAAIFDEAARNTAREGLAAEVARLTAGREVRVEPRLIEGEVETSLLARARELAADLVVLGAHGRPTSARNPQGVPNLPRSASTAEPSTPYAFLERLVLGSVAERMVRLAACPLLIVPPGAAELPGVTGDRRPAQVVVALDGRPASDGAIAFARQLRSRIPCDVSFVRLYWPLEEFQRLGLTGPRDLFSPDPDVVADLDRTLRLKVGILPGSGATSFAIESTWGEPAGRILDAARKRGADLLVMGAESRRGLARLAHPSVASRVARHAAGLAVVFVPPPAPDARTEVPSIFTVLAATDLSPAGNRSVPFAYAMVAGHGGVVELCHVHERQLASPAYAYDAQEGKLSDVERARLEAALRALVPAEAEGMGITTHVTVIDGGRTAQAIVQAAERVRADALVLGSHGKGAAVGSLLGSVSQAVVRESPRPVLLIPTGGHRGTGV